MKPPQPVEDKQKAAPARAGAAFCLRIRSISSGCRHDAGTVTPTEGELLHPLALHAWMM